MDEPLVDVLDSREPITSISLEIRSALARECVHIEIENATNEKHGRPSSVRRWCESTDDAYSSNKRAQVAASAMRLTTDDAARLTELLGRVKVSPERDRDWRGICDGSTTILTIDCESVELTMKWFPRAPAQWSGISELVDAITALAYRESDSK